MDGKPGLSITFPGGLNALIGENDSGKNDELLMRYRLLYEYMELINRIRDNQRNGMDIKNSVDAVVDSCIADGSMKDFLIKMHQVMVHGFDIVKRFCMA